MVVSFTKSSAIAKRPATPLSLIFVASQGDIEEKAARPLVAAEDFLTKPFFVADLVRLARKICRSRLHLEKRWQRVSRPGVIQGRLEEMGVAELMQSLEMGPEVPLTKPCAALIRLANYISRAANARMRGLASSKAMPPSSKPSIGPMANSKLISLLFQIEPPPRVPPPACSWKPCA